jgi:hypothetical protein
MRKSAMIAVLMIVGALPLLGQGDDKKEPGKAVIGIYHVAAGKHRDFLRWEAAREAASREAGLPPTQWYAHAQGDSWDYVSIGPDPTPEQQARVDELLKRKGLKTGFASGVEFRQFIASHTDTAVTGPLSAAELSRLAE